MLKFIKGIFDNSAEGKHRRRASWPKLLTAFLIVQPNDRSGGPRHGLPGIREGKNTYDGVHFFSILRGNLRQGYFPIIRWVWIVLRLVLIRMCQRALKTCVWVQRTDPPLKMKTHIWTSLCVFFYQHVFQV